MSVRQPVLERADVTEPLALLPLALLLLALPPLVPVTRVKLRFA
jgi:hypothetical protein